MCDANNLSSAGFRTG
jgi:hypothetical protein